MFRSFDFLCILVLQTWIKGNGQSVHPLATASLLLTTFLCFYNLSVFFLNNSCEQCNASKSDCACLITPWFLAPFVSLYLLTFHPQILQFLFTSYRMPWYPATISNLAWQPELSIAHSPEDISTSRHVSGPLSSCPLDPDHTVLFPCFRDPLQAHAVSQQFWHSQIDTTPLQQCWSLYQPVSFSVISLYLYK